MKRLIVTILLSGSFFTMVAQNTDSTITNSTNVQRDTMPGNTNSTMNNNSAYDSSHTRMNNNSTMDSMNHSMRRDTASDASGMNNMNQTSNMNRANMNNSSNNMNNMSPKGNMYGSKSGGSMNAGFSTANAALPVIEDYIPDNVVATLKSKYANNVYDITSMKSGQDQAVYMVRSFDNGSLKTETVSADGNVLH